ncbi:hypothetical protein AV521_30795 [Streptomyces sp. IMTB 2501]|uniref:hypothetical protein n=1 Tax=Streptomyces sp. IMTB 2501 TaxID=1776340 RepID=UPI00096C604B|nr:hypothetical protein [Streptomyces sp. IMTB 2501]OLZ65789.1 hypothetical protein AV521_30795 [Streptomyces sp. IMTB 2501]
MLSRKKLAAVSGLVGGLAVTCTGLAQGYAAADPGVCTRDLQGNVTCIQKIQGQIPEDGVIPHQDNCMPMQPITLPAALGNGTIKYGPEVTCSAPPRDKGDGKMEFPGLLD